MSGGPRAWWPAPALLSLAAPLFAIAACTTGPKDYLEYRSPSDPTSVMRRIAEGAEQCWFKSGAASFQDMVYSTERNAGTSRLLVIEKAAPEGLPKLVVTAAQDGRRTSVRLFGPLLASADSARIRADVDRWTSGVSGCG